MGISEGLERAREPGRVLKVELGILRFIYPNTYSLVSAPQPNVLLPLEKYPGVKGSRSDEGTISRIGATFPKVKTYNLLSVNELIESTPFRSGRLEMGGGKRPYSTRELRIVITIRSMGIEGEVGAVPVREERGASEENSPSSIP